MAKQRRDSYRRQWKDLVARNLWQHEMRDKNWWEHLLWDPKKKKKKKKKKNEIQYSRTPAIGINYSVALEFNAMVYLSGPSMELGRDNHVQQRR